MGHPVTAAAPDTRSLALELLSLSTAFEPFVPMPRRDGIEALSLLSGLEKVARHSIYERAQAATAQQAEKNKAKAILEARSATAQVPTRTTQTLALQSLGIHDPSIVKALLELQQRNKPTRLDRK